MAAENRAGTLGPELTRYKEASEVLTGQRGDVRDHAIRRSDAFSIDGRKRILETLGIATNDQGRIVQRPIFGPLLNLRLNFSNTPNMAAYTFANSPGFDDWFWLNWRSTGDVRFWSESLFQSNLISKRNFLFRVRDDGSYSELIPGIFSSNNADYDILRISDNYPDGFQYIGANERPGRQAFRFSKLRATEFFGTDKARMVIVARQTRGPILPLYSTLNTMFFQFSRYVNPNYSDVLPAIIYSEPIIPAFTAINAYLNINVTEDDSDYAAFRQNHPDYDNIPLNLLYPFVRPMLSLPSELTGTSDYEIVSIMVTR